MSTVGSPLLAHKPPNWSSRSSGVGLGNFDEENGPSEEETTGDSHLDLALSRDWLVDFTFQNLNPKAP